MEKMLSSIGILIISIIISIIIVFAIYNGDMNIIRDKIQQIGGEVITIEYKSPLNKIPFKLYTKDMRIYKITYKIKDEEKEGWVRFWALNIDWILN